jgi:hypothetical protein
MPLLVTTAAVRSASENAWLVQTFGVWLGNRAVDGLTAGCDRNWKGSDGPSRTLNYLCSVSPGIRGGSAGRYAAVGRIRSAVAGFAGFDRCLEYLYPMAVVVFVV